MSDIEDGNDLIARVKDEMKKPPKALSGSQELSELFDPAPTKGRVHFIVPGRWLADDLT
jgi:hypothetical protein